MIKIDVHYGDISGGTKWLTIKLVSLESHSSESHAIHSDIHVDIRRERNSITDNTFFRRQKKNNKKTKKKQKTKNKKKNVFSTTHLTCKMTSSFKRR